MSTDESEIVERLQNDDESTLSIVLKEIVPKLWPLLSRSFREVLSHEDIEEVVATALGKLWHNRAKFEYSKGDFQGWFYVILRNCALDRIRKNRPRVEEYLVVEALADLPSVSDEQKQSVLKAAVSSLNQREQQVILPLFEMSGASVSDLSKSLSASTGAVRQLRFRALRKLNAQLAENGYTIVRKQAKAPRLGAQEEYNDE